MIPIRIIYAMPLFNLAELIGVWKQTKCGITFVAAQKKKKKVLEEVEDIIKWSDCSGNIQSQIVNINRGCEVYGMINSLMQKMRETDSYYRMPFYWELINVWKAMLVAYDVLDESEIRIKEDEYDMSCPEDGAWVLEMANSIRAHWDRTVSLHQAHYEAVMKMIREEEKKQKEEDLSVEEQILRAEERNREFVNDKSRKPRLMGADSEKRCTSLS